MLSPFITFKWYGWACVIVCMCVCVGAFVCAFKVYALCVAVAVLPMWGGSPSAWENRSDLGKIDEFYVYTVA